MAFLLTNSQSHVIPHTHPTSDINWLTELIQANAVVVSATAPENPTAGKLWYNTTKGVFNIYNWSSWILVWPEVTPITKAQYDALSNDEKNDGRFYLITDNDGTIIVDWANVENKPTIPTSLWELSGTSDDITEWSSHLFMTPAERTNLWNQSWVNTGDQSASDFDIKDLADITNLRSTWSWKQDAISDLATIRSWASAWATAVQPNDNVSTLTNDAWYITNAVNDLTNYYTKTQTYTKAEVDQMISDFGWFEVVETLPTENIKTNVIYLKGPIGTWGDKYEEWIYSNNQWVLIGESTVDLSNYFNTFTDTSDRITEGSTNLFVTSSEKSTWNAKQDALVSGTNIKTVNGNSLLWSGDVVIPLGKNDIVRSTLPPQDTTVLWYDTANFVLNYYNDNAWKPLWVVNGWSVEPSYNITGNLWYDINNNVLKVYRVWTWWKDLAYWTSASTAPSTASAWHIWYDTANNVLKVYDWTNWIVTGKTYTAWNWISISNDEISIDTTVVATKTDLSSKQDTISDLATIRSWASAWATAIQPNDNVSELTNDAWYITSSALDDYSTTTEMNNAISTATSWLATESYVDTALSSKQDTLTAWDWINIDANNEISNTLPWPTIAASAPTGTEWALWYDTTNDILMAYDWTDWKEAWTQMKVLSYWYSTWQDFIDAYNKNAIVYCRASSNQNPATWTQWRMAFMAYVNSADNPTEVEFQYYRSRSNHDSAANQIDEVYVYKLVSANGWTWTVTQRNTAAKLVAWSNVSITWWSWNAVINATDTTYTASDGVDIDWSNNISVDVTDIIWTWLSEDANNNIIVDSTVVALKSDLSNYYTKTETYTKTEVDNLVASVWSFEVVATLPSADTADTKKIYLLWPIWTGADKYEEYIVTESEWVKSWTKIWETSIDLSGYATTTALTNWLASKQDTLVSGTNIKTINNESLLWSGNITISAPTYTAWNWISIDANDVISVDTDVIQEKLTAWDGITIENVCTDISDMQWPAPIGFHVPLVTEWQWLETIMDWLGLTLWRKWGTNLHMPFAGSRDYFSADLIDQGSYGYYWSSSPYGSDSPNRACNLNLDSSNVYANDCRSRANGFSVRCFKDSYVTPDSSWTVVQWTLWWAWIFWNQTEWLISITDWTTWYTIQDKNLWATTVYSYWDTLSEANMGYMYQWWNNYWFPSTWTISNTSSTKVDASSYWPWNYYSSSTFITWMDWSSVHNDNLRWGESQWSGQVCTNIITNTGVLSVNGSTGAVTVQPTLVSGTNIKTINNESLLWSGNITISAPTYTAWDWIDITNNEISVDTDVVQEKLTAWEWISIGEWQICTTESDRKWPSPSGFHVPSIAEWQWVKTMMENLDLTTWADWNLYFKMPFAGSREFSSADLDGQGFYGYYWSSSHYGSYEPYDAHYLYLYSSGVNTNYHYLRANGYSVRCFKNSYEAPDSSWIVAQWTLGSAWIFWNQSEWLISITSDWSTGYTMMDKNLWATIVYNDWDTLSESNCGKYYQWGNNYWFARTWTLTTSSIPVDASWYWPTNPYSSDTYITWWADWSSVLNDDLWWDTSNSTHQECTTGWPLTISSTVNWFNPSNTGTEWQVLTKTSTGYNWTDVQWWWGNVIAMTQAEYNALTTEEKNDWKLRIITDAPTEDISVDWSNVANKSVDVSTQTWTLSSVKIWVWSQTDYEALSTKDPNTLYFTTNVVSGS